MVDNLVVTAWPEREPSRRVLASVNRSGVFSLHDVPGIGDLEHGAGDDAYWTAVPRRPFVIDVDDLALRFLPFRFTVELPLRGLLELTCGSPPASVGPAPAGGVRMFTAPTRPAMPGSAVVRADLWDAVANAPAAWAVVQASIPSAAARGVPPVRAVADDRGQIALHLPCPDVEDLDGGSFESPSGPAPVPLTARTWSVDLAVSYGHLPAGAPAMTHRGVPIPDLCAAVTQPPATLWSDRARTTPLRRASLTYGSETILRSTGGGAGPQSVLLLTPGSPP
ncbi:MAG TPA: hypothetical protein VF469_36270 [Kofleriaceae bacterium]